MKNGCGHCHSCGTALEIVLDGEEWCPRCASYRRYVSHGWAGAYSEKSPCLRLVDDTEKPKKYIKANEIYDSYFAKEEESEDIT